MANPTFDLFKKTCDCVDTTWTPTGVERCSGTNVEHQEESNCGSKKWVVDRPQTWTDTGGTRCTATDVEKQQINDCGATKWVVSGPQVWEPTGETKCESNVTLVQEVNNCGKNRWTPTTQPCGYCPSLRLSCDGSPGFGFHIDDPKDPAATVEMAPCTGDIFVDSVWIYPASGPGHTVKITDCDGGLIGYAVNKSDCAPDCGCKDPVINVTNKFAPVTNVAAPAVTNNFAPTTNVAAPEVNITQPAPNVVAHALSDTGVLTTTLSDGSTVVSNPLPSC